MSIQEQQRRRGFLSTDALQAGAKRNQPPGQFSAYSPGAARPRQPQASGTPYGAPPSNLERMPQIGGSDMSYKQPRAPGSPYGAPPGNLERMPQIGGGDMAYKQPQGRPAPFTASYQGFDGSVSSQPNYAQRDAFINQITNQLGQMQAQSWQRPMGAPQFNFPGMWNQAGQMVQQGWQNPMAQPGYGMPRTADMRDRNGDGIDDRDAGYGPRRQTSKNYTPRNAYRTL